MLHHYINIYATGFFSEVIKFKCVAVFFRNVATNLPVLKLDHATMN